MRYVTEYRGVAIYQDEEDGYYVAFDENGKQISREATKSMVKFDIKESE